MDWSKVKGIAFDIDGVMTDGGLFCDPQGEFLRTYDAKDAFAVRMAAMHGIPCAVITGGKAESIRLRFVHCGVKGEDVHLKSCVKIRDFKHFCNKYGFDESEVVYFGDDLPDVPVLLAAGIGVAPADACAEAKEAADYVSPYPGGHWCVRDTIEMIMKAKGLWNVDYDVYESMFRK